jgi:outer membrane protein TolC
VILATFVYGDNLKELINYTNNHNKLLLSKKLSTKAKTEELKSSQSSSMPTIDIGGFYQSLNEKTPMIAGDIYSGYVKISYNIYDGRQKLSITKQKEDELKSIQFEKIAFQKSLALQIVQEFYTIKNIDATLNSLKEKQLTLNAQLQRVKKFFEANLSTKDDVDKLQSAYDTNSYNIESLKFQKSMALKELELKVGKNIASLDESKFKKHMLDDMQINDTIKSLEHKKNSLKNLANSVGSVYLPQITISDTYNINGYQRYDTLHPKGLDNQNKIMLSINLRVFDGGTILKSKQALMINSKAIDAQIQYYKQEQKMLYELSISRIKTAKLKIKSAFSALKSAKSAYKTIEEKYKAGIVDNVAYLDALSVQTEALSLYKKSLNDLEVAYAIYYYYAGKNIQEFIQ